jgi:ribosomal protein S18 acetylase RimI-like enzyme
MPRLSLTYAVALSDGLRVPRAGALAHTKDKNMIIRPTTSKDVADLQQVLEATQLFPAELLPEMLSGARNEGSLWLTVEHEGQAVGFCFAQPEAFAEGSWSMLAIAVHPEFQSRAFGSALVRHLEALLRKQDGRILIVDTSGTDAFAKTRAFYSRNGYAEEARIRDFWADGDDKVTFWKSLAA